tara:strand:+ start:4690 stop:4902 length:213 start_codon:yes stop_codon:yes gene_type:complete
MFEDARLILKKLKEFIEIEKERNKLMEDLSDQLGFDVTFSDEEVFNNALDRMNKELGIEINKELKKQWMK